MSPVRLDRPEQSRAVLSVLVVAVFGCLAPTVRADNDMPAGIIIPVHSSRMRGVAPRVEQAVKKPLRQFETMRALEPKLEARFTVVCDFNPDGQPAASDKYESCLELANMLQTLQKESSVRTVAWVHGSVSRHSVLPVLACEEIVFADDTSARLGKIVSRGAPVLREGQINEYQYVIKDRFTLPIVVRKMYDRALVVVKVNRAGALAERFREKKPGDRLDLEEELVENLGAGDTASFGFEQARAFDICQRDPANNLLELRKRYNLPESAVVRQPEKPIVCRIEVKGEVDGGLKEQLQRRLDRARELNADVVILQIDCFNGEVSKAAAMAEAILKLGDRSLSQPIETIAYVTKDARNTAALLILACDRIVMHPEAQLGAFDRYLDGRPDVEIELRDSLTEIAEKRGVPRALARALATRGARIHWVEGVKGKTDTTFIDDAVFVADQARPDHRWKVKTDAKQPSQGTGCLTLSAEDAKSYGVIDEIANDWKGACALAGVEDNDVRLVSYDMLDRIAEFLRDPITQGVLLLLAIACLILELKMPGTMVPGIISATCFVLYFWSQSLIHEEITTLALLLFLLGLVLIALEVFVIPGFGVTGISGIILVIGSLGLMAYGHWPRSGDDWVGLGRPIRLIGISLFGGVCLAFLLARYLPYIPGANRLFLKPEGLTEEGEETGPAAMAGPDLAPLLGGIGVAVSPLRPAGKMQIGDEIVDVVAEGGYIAPGVRVRVIEIEGNRVVVKEV